MPGWQIIETNRDVILNWINGDEGRAYFLTRMRFRVLIFPSSLEMSVNSEQPSAR